jgi:hypothetical protein
MLTSGLNDPSSKTVVIIKGNPKKMKGMEKLAESYYAAIAEYVKELGYEPTFDPGEPRTCPDMTAAFWIAHSRGVDREVCIEAEDQWRFLKFGALEGVIHPKDAKWQKSITDHLTTSELPPKEHFEFTRDQQKAIADLVRELE